MIKPWRHLERRTLVETRIFTVSAHRRVSATSGHEAEFYVLDAVDWVNVIAVTPDDRVLLVRQYRHGVERLTLEIPGGMVDSTDDSPESAARRELREETGYEADSWRLIGVVDPNPATHSNRCFTFLASGARQVGEAAPDAHEEIELVLAPAASVPDLLRDGEITHALVVAALHWWDLARR